MSIPSIDFVLFTLRLDHLAYISLILNFVLAAFFIAVKMFTWDVTWPWLLAWFKRKPLALEWTKSKHWKFHIPDIPEGFPNMWTFDGGRRATEVRREAVGYAPHKVPMMLFTSEYGAAVSPTEIEGERYYSPTKTLYLNQVKQRVEADEEGAEMYVKYPSHGLNPSEFVQYQQVNTDPNIMEMYADYKELEARKELQNPLSAFLTPEFLTIFIPVMIVGGIVYMWLSNNNQANECNTHLRQLYEAGVCTATNVKNAIVYNTTSLKTGGLIK